jgi:hypothetical protein
MSARSHHGNGGPWGRRTSARDATALAWSRVLCRAAGSSGAYHLIKTRHGALSNLASRGLWLERFRPACRAGVAALPEQQTLRRTVRSRCWSGEQQPEGCQQCRNGWQGTPSAPSPVNTVLEWALSGLPTSRSTAHQGLVTCAFSFRFADHSPHDAANQRPTPGRMSPAGPRLVPAHQGRARQRPPHATASASLAITWEQHAQAIARYQQAMKSFQAISGRPTWPRRSPTWATSTTRSAT